MPHKKVDTRKSEIMQKALELFISRGYEKTATNDIMDALGISRGCLYHHFSSKEEILDAAVTAMLTAERKRAEAIFERHGLSALDRLKAVIEFDSSAQPMADEVVELVKARENPTLIIHLLRKKLEIAVPFFVGIIEQGVGEGVFECEHPKETATIAVILSSLLFTDTVIQMTAEEAVRTAKAFQTTMEALLGVGEGAFDFLKVSLGNATGGKGNAQK